MRLIDEQTMAVQPVSMSLTANEKEAANRAEVTALLIRAGFRVYRPEADCYGEDLILRTPSGKFRAVQLKSSPEVDWKRYGKGKSLWMLFPNRKSDGAERKWFLVPHNHLYKYVKGKHGHAKCWKEAWHFPSTPKELGQFLEEFVVAAK